MEEIPEEWPAELDLEPEPDEELLRIMRDPRRGWKIRMVQQGARFMLWLERLAWRRDEWPHLFREVSFSGAVTAVLASVFAGFLLGWAYAPATILGGLVALIVMTVAERKVSDRPRHHLRWGFPSPGVRATMQAGVLAAPVVGLLAGAVAGIILALETTWNTGRQFAIVMAACVTLFALGCFGVYALFEQLRVRLVLHWVNLLPIRSSAFFDYGVRCLFLRRSGETYMFAHRSLQEFFATFCPADSNEPHPGLLGILVPGNQSTLEGDTGAQYDLGLLLLEQMDPPDLDGTRAWWTKAAEAGDISAQFALGLLLLEQMDPPDLDGARAWWTKAAEAGDIRAQFNLGILLEDRLDPPDLEGARIWWTRAAEAGHVRAQLYLAGLLEDRLDPPDLDGARIWYTRAAEAGDDEAAVDLGFLLADGFDPPDLNGARVWWTKAAEHGDAEAQFCLGVLAQEQEPPDLNGARTWWTQAARAGHTEAAFYLGMLLEDQLDPPDLDGAMGLYVAAAEDGHIEAQYRLGLLLVRPGVLDVTRGTVWLTKAAEAGYVDAQFILGGVLELLANPPDLEGAHLWYRRAAEADDPDAQFHLATLLMRLDTPDLISAFMWLNRAARAGHAKAREMLERFGHG